MDKGMSSRIDKQTEDKTRALIGLTHKLNEERDKVKKDMQRLDDMYAKKAKEVAVALSELDNRLEDPEVGLVETLEEFSKRESELTLWEKNLISQSEELSTIEEKISGQENSIRDSQDKISNTFIEFLNMTRDRLRVEGRSLQVRMNMIDTKKKSLDAKHNVLNDRIRSYDAAYNEFLEKQNGKPKR